MAITNMQQMFINELGDIYDAEHQFLEGQQKMLAAATLPKLKSMITTHIKQTEQHINNLEKVFQLLGEAPKRVPCAGAKGLVAEAGKLMTETAAHPEITDYAIAGSADKVEHYEILSYNGLIAAATEMGKQDIVTLFQQNLKQEQETAQLIEENEPQLLQRAMTAQATLQNRSQQTNAEA
jgi:ferritin-like metal-binding protein YciE